MKKILVIDWILIPLFVFSTFTGIKLHIAGHTSNHALWHDWAVLHVVSSTLFLIAVVYHATTHRNWYKGIFSKNWKRKSKTTVSLSLVFLFVSLTGISLLSTEGTNSTIGLWHYKSGLIVGMLSLLHILKHLPVLRKALNKG